MPVSGRFIVVDGIDGSGKTTVCRLLAEELRQRWGLSVLQVRQPGIDVDHPNVRRISEAIYDIAPRNPDPFALSLMFVAARIELMQKIILPALEQGQWVISDRAWPSTFAYCDADDAEVWERITVLRERFAVRHPDVTVLLHLPLDVAEQRIETARGMRTVFEAHERLARAARRYEEYVERRPATDEPIVVVDATRPPADVADSILTALTALGLVERQAQTA